MASAWELGPLLTDLATFYTRSAITGQSTVILLDNLPCRVASNQFHDAAGDDRAMLAATRSLVWTADFQPPLDVQVELNHDGRRWNVRAETLRYLAQPDGGLGHWECDLEGTGRAPRTPR